MLYITHVNILKVKSKIYRLMSMKPVWSVLWLRFGETSSRWGKEPRIYWISCRWQPTRGGPPSQGSGKGLTTPHRKKRNLLRNVTQDLGFKRALVNTVMKPRVS